MLDAASCLFEEGPKPVVILGTDAPTLPLARIEEAAHALNAHHLSIVPSEDGGYVLIGLRSPYEALFRDIAWSTENVYRGTMAKAKRAGLSVYEGATHCDVDTPEDLARLKAELQEHPELSPHTAELVETLWMKKGRGPKWSAPQKLTADRRLTATEQADTSGSRTALPASGTHPTPRA